MSLSLRLALGRKLTWQEGDDNFAGLASGVLLEPTALAAKVFTSLTLSGALLAADGSIGAPGIAFASQPNLGVYRHSPNTIGFTSNGNCLFWDGAVFYIQTNGAQIYMGTANDLQLHRDSADILGQRRGVNAQTNALYNTFTDGANYELLYHQWTGNQARIYTQAAGTGVVRDLAVGTGNNSKWIFQGVGGGHLTPSADNTLDLGTEGQRLRTLISVLGRFGDISGADSATSVVVRGNAGAVRIGTAGATGTIDGVDNTGSVAYQPLTINGSVLNLAIQGTTRWAIDTGSTFYPALDNNYDLGGPSNRVRNLYVGTAINAERLNTPLITSPGSPVPLQFGISGLGIGWEFNPTLGSGIDWTPVTDASHDIGSSPKRVRSIYASTLIQIGGFGVQSNALLSAVANGNAIEFGHGNSAGYRSHLGCNASDGAPWIAFNSEAGTTVNTIRTRGVAGSVLMSDLAGGFRFFSATNVNADDQTPVEQVRITAVASAVNFHQLFGASTGNNVGHYASGSDGNVGIDFASKGAGGIRFLSAGGTTENFRVVHNTSGVNFLYITSGTSGNKPILHATGSDGSPGMQISTKGAGSFDFRTNAEVDSRTQLRVGHVDNAVNNFVVFGSATTLAVTMQAEGSDTNVGLQYISKGLGNISFYSHSGSSEIMRIETQSSVVNRLHVIPSVTGIAVGIAPQGSDSNISFYVQPKGTGEVQILGPLRIEGASIIQNSQSANYTAVLTDANKGVFHPVGDNNPRTFTIPANSSVPYAVGTCLTFTNKINTVTIAITTDTLTWAGVGTTGSRTLGPNCTATAMKITTTEWMISGDLA